MHGLGIEITALCYCVNCKARSQNIPHSIAVIVTFLEQLVTLRGLALGAFSKDFISDTLTLYQGAFIWELQEKSKHCART
jgi:hypothetical protein